MTDLGKIILEFNTCTILVHICLEYIVILIDTSVKLMVLLKFR